MQNCFAEEVYNTLRGVLLPEYCIPGVENAFADGQPCDKLYTEMLNAYERLRIRLNAGEEDVDVEIIIDSLMRIAEILAYKMYDYGILLGK